MQYTLDVICYQWSMQVQLYWSMILMSHSLRIVLTMTCTQLCMHNNSLMKFQRWAKVHFVWCYTSSRNTSTCAYIVTCIAVAMYIIALLCWGFCTLMLSLMQWNMLVFTYITNASFWWKFIPPYGINLST